MSFVAPLSVSAATDNQNTGSVVLPQITIENLQVSDRVSAGQATVISFSIRNVENRTVFDVGYRYYLLNENGQLFFQKDFPRKYYVPAFEKVEENGELILPATLPGGAYELKVAAISPNGSDLGSAEKKIELSSERRELLVLENLNVSGNGQKDLAKNGVVVNSGEKVTISGSANGSFSGQANIKYSVYKYRDFATEDVKSGPAFTLSSNASEFSFDVVSPLGDAPFTVAFWVEDSAGNQISELGKAVLGVFGKHTNLKYLTIDRGVAKKGEVVSVELVFDPIMSKVPFGTTLAKVWVGDSYAEKSINFSETSVALVDVTLKGDIDEPLVRVVLEKDGEVLLDYKTNTAESDKSPSETVAVSGGKKLIYFGILAFVLVASVIFLIKKKMQTKTVVVLVLAIGSLFFVKSDVAASFDSDSSYTTVPPVSTCTASQFYVDSFFIYKNGSTTPASQNTIFRPGDTIRFDGSVDSGAAGCSYYGTGDATHRIGGVDLGGTNGESWDVTYTIPNTLDSITYKDTYARTTYENSIRSSGTAGAVRLYRSMTIKMGPAQVPQASMTVQLPPCSNSNYNATFNFTGSNLAENYRVEWATNAGFSTGTGNQVLTSTGAGAKSLTTTGSPLDRTQTYFWRVVAYNSIAGSEITTTAATTFGPVNTCPVAPTNGSVTSAPSCVKNDGATYYTFTTTYNDANGAADISQAYILINSTTSQNAGTAPVGAVAMYMTPSDGTTYIRNATDISWSFSATGNTYAGINRPAFTRSLSGNTVTVNWSIRFFPTWVGESANIYLRTIDSGGLDTGYEDKGDLAIPCPVPANPTNLTVSTGCNGSNSEVTFTFTDNANNEDIYWLDVNSAAWTGTGTPSPWGVKTFNRSAAERTATGNVTWIWRSTDALSGTPTVPANNTTYWWRVKANNTNGDSAHVYPANTLTPPGASFTTPNCVVPAPIVPTPSGVSNLPSCVNPGQTYGTALVFGWNTVANATSYTVRLTQNVNTGGDFSTKTVATNSASGTGGWGNPNANPLVTWLSGGNLALSANVTYFYAVSAAGPGGDSGYDLAGKSLQFGPVPECPPSNASNLGATAGCDAQGRPQVTFTFTDTSSNEDRFWLDVNGAAWTGSGAPSPWALKTINRSAGEKSGTGVVTFVWTAVNTLDSGDADPVLTGTQLIPAQGKTYWWRVKANSTTAGDSAHVYPANTLTPPGTSVAVPNCPPTIPGNLSASPSCVGGNAQILFRFQDLSATEDQFIIEVNDRAWDGTGSGPSPYGVKSIPRTGGAKTGSGSFVNFIWSVSNGMDSGDTNSTLAGAQLTPAQGKTYYWRMRTREGASNDSANVYPNGGAGTLTPPGVSVVTPNCSPADLEVSFVPGTWKDSVGVNPAPLMQFEPNERVTVDVQVKNLGGVNSPATDLYVFYKNLGTQMPDCSLATPRAITTAPLDSTGGTQGYAVPALSGGASSPPISVSLTIDAVAGSVYAYAVPKCEFDASPWGNNVASQTYIVDADGFIETRGGDVGAVGDISVSVKSKNLATPIYQGDYIINANTMNANVDSKNNWILKGYAAKQVPTGGLYNFFDAKYKGKATEQTAGNCTFTGSEVFVNCKGNLTFGGAEVAPGISRVFFVEQDLRFQKNFVLGTNASVLFIVKGNVNVDLAVNRIDGVFVVKGTFDDSDVADAGVASAGDALTVNGAVYVESATGLSLTRYFTTPINKTTPANKFIWDPKFMIQLSQLVGTRPIIWKEVAP